MSAWPSRAILVWWKAGTSSRICHDLFLLISSPVLNCFYIMKAKPIVQHIYQILPTFARMSPGSRRLIPPTDLLPSPWVPEPAPDIDNEFTGLIFSCCPASFECSMYFVVASDSKLPAELHRSTASSRMTEAYLCNDRYCDEAIWPIPAPTLPGNYPTTSSKNA